MPATLDQIRDLLATYERSLNTSDAALAASCYAPDGVFMPANLPTASGKRVRAAYDQVFAAIRLNISFTVDELAVAGDDTVYALTRSSGTQTVIATGTTAPEANREIFVFRRGASGWKISRYMFNKAG